MADEKKILWLHDEELQSEAVYGREESEIAAMTEYKTYEVWCENNGQKIRDVICPGKGWQDSACYFCT